MNAKGHGFTFAAGCLFVVSALAVFLSGCALTVDKVTLDYVPQTGVQKVALKEPVRVNVDVVDIRSKKDRVSSKKNGYGMEMAAIVAENDVADVVANAIVAELRSRGFEIGQGHVIVNAELQKFYNDFKVGFFSGDAEAEVVINTKVQGVDKAVRFAKVVAGEGKEPNIQLSSGENAKLALDRALADAIARLFSDPAFVDALITAGKL